MRHTNRRHPAGRHLLWLAFAAAALAVLAALVPSTAE
jgi:hypothetical protein